MGDRQRLAIAAVCAVLAAASACGSGDLVDDGASTARPALPTGVTTAGAGDTATLGGLELVVVRTLPAAAIAADELDAAGAAVAADGGTLALARAEAAGVAPWEYVSPSPDGWRVWQPAAFGALLAEAGPAAIIVEATEQDWPDSCLGLARQDEVCLQVITPGFRVIIEQGGKRIEYHSARTGGFRIAP
jgi:hypothetical protein